MAPKRKTKIISKPFSGLNFATVLGNPFLTNLLKIKDLPVVNSNNLLQLCWH
jgi:hypothetical protein